jgi:hypothetical protein
MTGEEQKNKYTTVYARIKKEELQHIREKGYSVAELIRVGLQAKEVQESFASFVLRVAEKLENTERILESITNTNAKLINEQQSIISSLNPVITRLDLIMTSLSNAANKFDKILEEQRYIIDRINSLIDKNEEKFNSLIEEIDKLTESRVFELERKLEDMLKRLNLSFRVIDKLVPESKATQLKDAIMRKDENKISELLNSS